MLLRIATATLLAVAGCCTSALQLGSSSGTSAGSTGASSASSGTGTTANTGTAGTTTGTSTSGGQTSTSGGSGGSTFQCSDPTQHPPASCPLSDLCTTDTCGGNDTCFPLPAGCAGDPTCNCVLDAGSEHCAPGLACDDSQGGPTISCGQCNGGGTGGTTGTSTSGGTSGGTTGGSCTNPASCSSSGDCCPCAGSAASLAGCIGGTCTYSDCGGADCCPGGTGPCANVTCGQGDVCAVSDGGFPQCVGIEPDGGVCPAYNPEGCGAIASCTCADGTMGAFGCNGVPSCDAACCGHGGAGNAMTGPCGASCTNACQYSCFGGVYSCASQTTACDSNPTCDCVLDAGSSFCPPAGFYSCTDDGGVPVFECVEGC